MYLISLDYLLYFCWFFSSMYLSRIIFYITFLLWMCLWTLMMLCDTWMYLCVCRPVMVHYLFYFHTSGDFISRLSLLRCRVTLCPAEDAVLALIYFFKSLQIFNSSSLIFFGKTFNRYEDNVFQSVSEAKRTLLFTGGYVDNLTINSL